MQEKVPWCHCNPDSDIKSAHKIQKDKISHFENLILQWHTERNGPISWNGQCVIPNAVPHSPASMTDPIRHSVLVLSVHTTSDAAILVVWAMPSLR